MIAAALMALYALGGSIPAWSVAAGISVLIGALCIGEALGGEGSRRLDDRAATKPEFTANAYQLGVEPMRVLITGATGTIGLAVADALRSRGDQVVALSRDPERGRRVLGERASRSTRG